MITCSLSYFPLGGMGTSVSIPFFIFSLTMVANKILSRVPLISLLIGKHWNDQKENKEKKNNPQSSWKPLVLTISMETIPQTSVWKQFCRDHQNSSESISSTLTGFNLKLEIVDRVLVGLLFVLLSAFWRKEIKQVVK